MKGLASVAFSSEFLMCAGVCAGVRAGVCVGVCAGV